MESSSIPCMCHLWATTWLPGALPCLLGIPLPLPSWLHTPRKQYASVVAETGAHRSVLLYSTVSTKMPCFGNL